MRIGLVPSVFFAPSRFPGPSFPRFAGREALCVAHRTCCGCCIGGAQGRSVPEGRRKSRPQLQMPCHFMAHGSAALPGDIIRGRTTIGAMWERNVGGRKKGGAVVPGMHYRVT